MKRNVDRKTLEALARLSATGLSHGKGFVSWPCHAPLLQVVRRNVDKQWAMLARHFLQ